MSPENSDDDDQAPCARELTGRICLMIPFAEWPFALLEVDLSTRKSPDTWGPMDPDMAAAIGRAAQREAREFEISPRSRKWHVSTRWTSWHGHRKMWQQGKCEGSDLRRLEKNSPFN